MLDLIMCYMHILTFRDPKSGAETGGRMASAKHSLETIFAEIRDAGNHSRRLSLRRHAETYRRGAATLLYWTFPANRAAVIRAIADPEDPAVTRTLCRALWRDFLTAKALPRYLAGRPLRISALRMLFACECTLYLRQRKPARPLTTGEWLTGVCREIEARPAPGRAQIIERMRAEPGIF